MPPPSVDTASVVHADGERPGRRREAAPHAWPASAEQAGGGGGGGAAPSGGARPPRPQTRTLWGRVESRSVAFVGMFFVTLTAASLYSLLAPFFPSVAGTRPRTRPPCLPPARAPRPPLCRRAAPRPPGSAIEAPADSRERER